MGARLATVLSVLAGALLASQSRVNGALTPRLGPGAAVPTAAISFCVGVLVLAAAVLVRGAHVPAGAALQQGPRPRAWWFSGGLAGAALVGATAAAVPSAGVALTAVSAVAGQTVGSLVVDTVGLGPAGRQPLSPGRLAAVAVAAVGLVLAELGRGGAVRPGLLALVAVAGALTAGQAAANGRLQAATGQALVAALTSFTVGALVLVAVTAALLATGTVGPLHLPPPRDALLFAGGLGGASYITIASTTVRVVGVLRLSLALTAGQLLAGVLLDLLLPGAQPLRLPTVLGAGVVLLAVMVAARAARAGAGPCHQPWPASKAPGCSAAPARRTVPSIRP